MNIDIQATNVFYRNLDAYNDPKIRFILNQGGARSSKTRSISQLLFVEAINKPHTKISVIRKFKTDLNKSFRDDFKEFLIPFMDFKLFEIKFGGDIIEFNNGSTIQLLGVDDPQKIRGVKHDILYVNEANELGDEEWMQLNIRTGGKIFIDFNPSEDESHWIHKLLGREETVVIKSTYKDNPFLPDAEVKEIEYLVNTDEDWYNIYALGLPPRRKERIFSKFEMEVFPEDLDWSYGMDFGYSDPTTLIQVAYKEKKLYLKELIYQTHLNIDQIIELMKSLGVSTSKKIFCDSARPDLIETLHRAGFNTTKSNKAIKAGLDKMRNFVIHVDPESQNLLKELRNYKWRKRGDVYLDEPEGGGDHCIDAARYATMGIHTTGTFRVYSFDT